PRHGHLCPVRVRRPSQECLARRRLQPMGRRAHTTHPGQWGVDGVGPAAERTLRVRLHRRWRALGPRSAGTVQLRRVRHEELDRDGRALVPRLGAAVVATMMSTLVTTTLAAQHVVTSLDLSGTTVWYADSIQSGGGSLSPTLRLD